MKAMRAGCWFASMVLLLGVAPWAGAQGGPYGTAEWGAETYGVGSGAGGNLVLEWEQGTAQAPNLGTLRISGGLPGNHLFIGISFAPFSATFANTTFLIPPADPATLWLLSDPNYIPLLPNPAHGLLPFDANGDSLVPLNLVNPSLAEPLVLYAQAFSLFASWESSLGLAFTFSNGGRTYYVSESGSDSAEGTEPSPWRTISRVNAEGLADHDTVLLRAGDRFSDATLTATGASGLRLGRYEGGPDPVLESFDTHDLVSLLECPGARIEDLALCNGPGHADLVLQGNVDGTSVHGLTTRGGSVAVWVTNQPSGYLTVQDCDLQDAWFDSVATAGTAHAEVSYCEIRNSGLQNPAIGAGDPLTAHEQSTIDAHHNTLIDNLRGAFVHINTQGENRFWNNFVVASDAAYVCLQQSPGVPGGGSTLMYNNIIKVTGSQSTKVITGNTNGHITAYNNTIVNQSTNQSSITVWAVDGTVDLVNSVVVTVNGIQVVELGGYFGAQNVFWSSQGSPGVFVSGVPVLLEWSRWQENLQHDLTSIGTDPSIANESGSSPQQFRLRSGSPAIGLSSNLSGLFGLDYFDSLRPATGSWASGAHERN